MSIVDGCVLVVCSGADGQAWPLADFADETAPDAAVEGRWPPRVGRQVTRDLPASWTDDRDHCRAAGVADEVGFATRAELAADMIDAAVTAGMPARWVTADEAYGNNTALRAHLRELGLGYVLAVARSHHVPLDGGKVDEAALLGGVGRGTATSPTPAPMPKHRLAKAWSRESVA